jgi:hypothetical protein
MRCEMVVNQAMILNASAGEYGRTPLHNSTYAIPGLRSNTDKKDFSE